MSDEVTLVIKIPKWFYEETKEFQHPTLIDKAIMDGTLLPKNHGRLIDADVLADGFEDNYEFCEVVNTTPTIIEADMKEVSE